ncbi:MAG: prepilin-type N-terminal cleavage/methylation domain-containing protein [bacterium]
MIKKLIKRKKGFTLIELLVVIAIIIILAAILLPYIINRVEDSRISRMTGEIRSLKTAALLYYNDLNVFPNSWDDLVVNSTPPNINWKGPYIEKVPNSTTAIWNNSSPWKTNMRIIVEYNNAGFNFAGQANFDFTKAIGLEVVNPKVSGQDAIPWRSLQKIDIDLDNGLDTTGLIVGGAANAASLSAITPQNYSAGNTSLYVFLQGLK